nr:uncharacterized protein LOC114821153 [Malus domestica]
MTNAGWILDFGATDHMTYDKTLFQSMTHPHRKCVATANGSTAAVVGVGTDIQTKEIIGRGTKRDGLYYVDDVVHGKANLVHVSRNSSLQKMVATQYSSVIKVLRTDNGGEYVNSELSTFFRDQGILHETTCSYTPQQNGVAERKNRHILETARALLIGGSVPKSFWPDAITYAVYVINRMPSRVVEFRTPLQVLTEHVLVVSTNTLTPRVFGCVAYVHIHKIHRSKLDPCAFRCVFVGLHPTRKVTSVTTLQLATWGVHGAVTSDAVDARSLPVKEPVVSGQQLLIEEEAANPCVGVAEEECTDGQPAVAKAASSHLSSSTESLSNTSSLDILEADGSLDKYKARLVAKGYSQTYGVDYQETFSPVAKMNTVRVLISLAENLNWPLKQFDVKNAFLHGHLEEEVYMDFPPGYSNGGKMGVCRLRKSLYGLKQSPRAWFRRLTQAMRKNGYFQSHSDHTLFVKRRNDKETGMLGCKPVDTPIVEKHYLGIYPDQEPVDKGRYQRLVGRLIYLAHTRSDIAYAVSMVSQFMHSPSVDHMAAVMRILAYLKSAPGKGILYKNSGHLRVEGFIDANWAGFIANEAISLYCDNKSARENAENPVQHDRTKHVEVDSHFIKEKLEKKIVSIPFVNSEEQLVDILTHAVCSRLFGESLVKLGMCDIYAPT